MYFSYKSFKQTELTLTLFCAKTKQLISVSIFHLSHSSRVVVKHVKTSSDTSFSHFRTNFTSTKPFIDLKICKRRLSNSPLNNVLSRSRDEALLFCYFNNPDAFKTYIKYFYGNYVIIIGPPLQSKTKRSNPMPETPNFENPWLWYKVYKKQFGRDKDLLVIWKYNPNAATQVKRTGQNLG